MIQKEIFGLEKGGLNNSILTVYFKIYQHYMFHYKTVYVRNIY